MTLNTESSAFSQQVGGSHYQHLAIQPMEYSLANGLDAAQHTVIKYVTRFRDKGGIADLLKAIHTLEMMIEFEVNQTPIQSEIGNQDVPTIQNDKIKFLAELAGYKKDGFFTGHLNSLEFQKFAELLIEECCSIVQEETHKITHSITKHFNVGL